MIEKSSCHDRRMTDQCRVHTTELGFFYGSPESLSLAPNSLVGEVTMNEILAQHSVLNVDISD